MRRKGILDRALNIKLGTRGLNWQVWFSVEHVFSVAEAHGLWK